MVDKKITGRGKNPRSAKTQFKPGLPSPNPVGRPKGSKGRNTIIRSVLSKVVSGNVDGRSKKVTVSEASLLRLSQMAISGDRNAIKDILALWKESEDAIAADCEADYPYSAADGEMIEEIYGRMKACEE